VPRLSACRDVPRLRGRPLALDAGQARHLD
jgi:hypothetical protein